MAQTSGSPTRVRWTYRENDTTARCGSHVQFVSVPECANQMSCEYAPKKAGRMELSVRLSELAETRYAKSEVVPAAGAAARLALTCTSPSEALPANHVTRGREIVCTVRKEPADAAGELVVTRGLYRDVVRTDGDVTSPEWSGPMVNSGTVEVRATIGGGSVLRARQTVRVERRGWSTVQFRMPGA